jgi:hypothetical protein
VDAAGIDPKLLPPAQKRLKAQSRHSRLRGLVDAAVGEACMAGYGTVVGYFSSPVQAEVAIKALKQAEFSCCVGAQALRLLDGESNR